MLEVIKRFDFAYFSVLLFKYITRGSFRKKCILSFFMSWEKFVIGA